MYEIPSFISTPKVLNDDADCCNATPTSPDVTAKLLPA
jgi:hypothetical protein